MEYLKDRFLLPEEPRAGTKHVLSLLLEKIQPLLLGLRKKLTDQDDSKMSGLRDVYTLCSNQICKCIINLLEVFKLEVEHRTILQDSRQYLLERLSWCISKLISIDNNFDPTKDTNESSNDSINVTTMYFVNWIDHTFEVLGKLADAVYKNNYKEPDEVCEQWKRDMVECVSELHVSTDELLLSAMTLCKYCLANDQHIVKARCQVVLRETKSLLSELIEGDLSSSVKASIDTLKLPIMPSNVNVLIDVLKDVLYSLETNTNTALLALVVNCFCGKSPIQVLREHYYDHNKGSCPCIVRSEDEEEDCSFVKEFDLYNERLLQIGNFAVSCSSDQNRILSLRSGLASLEALDPHLVPALMISPDSLHSTLLVNSWTREVNEIRDSVFLIVDPAAFAEKSKQMMHQKLVSILKEETHNEADVCSVIDIGCVVSEFFMVYDRYEPDALTDHGQLMSLVADLIKVQNECKIVSNLLTFNKDFKYDIKMPNITKEVSTDQLSKRLKLLYTLVTRIHNLIRPKDNEDNLFTSEMADEEPQMAYKNTTHTVVKSSETYVHTKRVPNIVNASRSMFARTNIRSSTRNFPLSKLTKRFKTTICTELSFSAQLDHLLTSDEEIPSNRNILNNLDRVKEKSVLYNYSPLKTRSSLRKAVLNKHCKVPFKKDATVDGNLTYDKDSMMDETASLQITDILNQMNDMTNMLSTTKQSHPTTQANKTKNVHNETKNVLRINVNNQNTTISKHIWNIPVNSSTVEMPLEDTNMSHPSNVNTLERIHDLDFVESKLNSLKSQLETSL